MLSDLEGPTAVAIHSDAAAPAEVSFGRYRVLLVDRCTGKVLGESAPRARGFFEFHGEHSPVTRRVRRTSRRRASNYSRI